MPLPRALVRKFQCQNLYRYVKQYGNKQTSGVVHRHTSTQVAEREKKREMGDRKKVGEE